MLNNNLSHSSVSFGLNNPQAALYRANKLKEQYAQQGLKYLMPNEVLSDKQIAEKLKTVDKYIKYFIKTGTMVEETVQYVINKILPPSAKDSILVKDISKLEESMIKKNYSQATINQFKNVGGLTVPPNGKEKATEIFVKFSDAKGSKADQEFLEGVTIHELQHALKRIFQNIISSDRYKFLTGSDENKFNPSFFHQFESKFYPYINYSTKPPEFTDKEFFKAMQVSSRDELYKKFASTLDEIEKNNSKDINDYMNNKHFGKYAKKSFFESLKNSANDEKYSFKVERDIKDPKDYTYVDFFPKLYSEMARFFSLQKKQTKFN